jgi:hypothetical protein
MIRLSCGHTASITDPRAASWLTIDGEVTYHCPICGSERAIVATVDNAAAESSQLIDELERLATLHDSGALTDTEFQAAKARLLGHG